MAAVVKDILVDCIQQAMGLPRDPIQIDDRDLALASFNENGRIIWDSWSWDNEKIDEFEAPAADADGIITFAADVETIRAIKAVKTGTTDSTTRIWNQDDLIAAAHGVVVDSDKFIHLADYNGLRRIRVATDEAVTSYRVLALARWVDVFVDPNYDEDDPSATPLDYRVKTFIIDRAEPALRAAIKDDLRGAIGRRRTGNADKLLNMALQRETYDSDRERRVDPRYPMFIELGDWY